MQSREYQREYRRKTNNACTKKYERTKKGKLMRIYRNMLSRVAGIQKQKSHLYEGKSILDRDEFYSWAMGCPEYHRMFDEWEASGYDRKLCPTVDRINPCEGYEIGNMRWLTHSENSALGAKNRESKKRYICKGLTFDSAANAAEFFGVTRQAIHWWVRHRDDCWDEDKKDAA